MKEKESAKQTDILDELINTATELPAASQELLLMMARGMAYTRKCLTSEELDLIGERKHS